MNDEPGTEKARPGVQKLGVVKLKELRERRVCVEAQPLRVGDGERILYYASLIMSFVVLPVILGLGARREKRWCGEPPKDSQPHGESPGAQKL